MRDLLNTVYHLSGAMEEGVEVGFGVYMATQKINNTTWREEYRFGSLNGYETKWVTLGANKVVTYPCQGSTNIPPAFIPANESPNPFPGMTDTSQSVGSPIYIKVDRGQTLNVATYSVTASASNTVVPTTLLTQANDPNRASNGQAYIGAHEAFVVPLSALNPNTTYRVDLTGTVNRTPFTRSFAMSTGQ